LHDEVPGYERHVSGIKTRIFPCESTAKTTEVPFEALKGRNKS